MLELQQLRRRRLFGGLEGRKPASCPMERRLQGGRHLELRRCNPWRRPGGARLQRTVWTGSSMLMTLLFRFRVLIDTRHVSVGTREMVCPFFGGYKERK